MEQKTNPKAAAAWERSYPEAPLEEWDGQDSSAPSGSTTLRSRGAFAPPATVAVEGGPALWHF